MKEHYISPFDSDAEAQEVIDTSRQLQHGHWRNWEAFAPDEKLHVTLDGNYTFAELIALIHFHPVLVKRRAAGIPEPTSDEVRVLELAVKKLSEALNELVEACDGGLMPESLQRIVVDVIKAPSRKAYMKARACLPAEYSMSLTKKENKNGV